MDKREKNLLVKLIISLGIIGIISVLLFVFLSPLGKVYIFIVGIGTFVSMYTVSMLIAFNEIRR